MATVDERELKAPKYSSEIEALMKDLGQVRNDLKSIMETAVGQASSETSHLVDTARDGMKSGKNSVESYIEHRPFTTVLVALGAGMILAKVFSK